MFDDLTAPADVTVPGRLWLRRPTPDDLEVVHAIHSDPRTNIHPAGVVGLTAPPMSVIGFTSVRQGTWTDVPILNLYYRCAADHHGVSPVAWCNSSA